MIRALLYRDIRNYFNIYKLKGVYNTVVVAVYLFLCLNSKIKFAAIVLNLLIFSILPATFNLDMGVNSTKYLIALPIEKKKLVLSKIKLVILLNTFTLTINAIFFHIIRRGEQDLFFSFVLEIFMVQMMMSLLNCIYIPIRYKYDLENSLVPFIFSCILLILVYIGIAYITFAVLFPVVLINLKGNMNLLALSIIVEIMLIFILFLYVMYILSIKILKNKEY